MSRKGRPSLPLELAPPAVQGRVADPQTLAKTVMSQHLAPLSYGVAIQSKALSLMWEGLSSTTESGISLEPNSSLTNALFSRSSRSQ